MLPSIPQVQGGISVVGRVIQDHRGHIVHSGQVVPIVGLLLWLLIFPQEQLSLLDHSVFKLLQNC